MQGTHFLAYDPFLTLISYRYTCLLEIITCVSGSCAYRNISLKCKHKKAKKGAIMLTLMNGDPIITEVPSPSTSTKHLLQCPQTRATKQNSSLSDMYIIPTIYN